ncbi:MULTISPECIES: rod shape-determining protein MreD [Paenibacillus]|uniref:Rod shape-determining protein MreD n=1 Tax=Paenibacillus campinasensis TaxID=66347 RepID=A0A268EG15_9BACL|nr:MULTISPECIES: rod shape-determining protein MreD [Paenibacillus]MUG67781.1 rod shape-determining protein MreD [Paenibacillus campinasensis]PAD72062.1 rod shape-determining protein MreD [Paenibacillus campinasensis]PAK48106.1 rod shape-determining protein MreD [Paenibacillus sp. 7541]
MKRKQVLFLLLFLLFILQGTVFFWLTPSSWQLQIYPNFVFVAILFVSVYYHRHTGLVLGLIFGMIHDVIYYGEMIGTYSFAMGVSAYIMGLLFQMPRAPLPIMMTVVLLGSLLFDSTLFGIYKVFSLSQSSYDWALLHHMLPNLLVHFVFALIIYVPLRKQLEIIAKSKRNQTS